MSNISDEEQLRIMRTQLNAFSSLVDKVGYLTEFLDPDPIFTDKNRLKIRMELLNKLKEQK